MRFLHSYSANLSREIHLIYKERRDQQTAACEPNPVCCLVGIIINTVLVNHSHAYVFQHCQLFYYDSRRVELSAAYQGNSNIPLTTSIRSPNKCLLASSTH